MKEGADTGKQKYAEALRLDINTSKTVRNMFLLFVNYDFSGIFL